MLLSLLLKYELYNSGYLACKLPDSALVSSFLFTVRVSSLHMFREQTPLVRLVQFNDFTHCNFLFEKGFQIVQLLILLPLPP